MNIVTTVEIDLGAHRPHPRICAKQGDAESRILRLVLQNAGTPYAVEAGTRASLLLRGETARFEAQGAFAEDGSILTTIPAGAMAAAGELQGDLVLEQGSRQTVLSGFALTVEPMPLSGVLNPSDSDYSMFARLLTAALQCDRSVSEAKAAAEEARQAASGGTGGSLPFDVMTAAEYAAAQKQPDRLYLVYEEA